ncbi:MAG: hypothetical protein KJZ72_18925, partial [Anaerolineales bacterium]|nr:hypothetical protein [Anaerolineales bacterium]
KNPLTLNILRVEKEVKQEKSSVKGRKRTPVDWRLWCTLPDKIVSMHWRQPVIFDYNANISFHIYPNRRRK